MSSNLRPKPVKEHRFDLIHISRGLAALLVLFGHVSTATDFRFPWLFNALGDYPGLGVDVFFMISGFVVPWSLFVQGYTREMFPRYILRRLVRLDPPYFAMVAAGVALAAYRSQRAGLPFPFSLSTIALHLGYLSGLTKHSWIMPIFWTLGIEFQFYLLMGIAYPFLPRIPAWIRSVSVTKQSARNTTSHVPTLRGLTRALLAVALLQLAIVLINDSGVVRATWLFYCAYFGAGVLAFAVSAMGLHWGWLLAYCIIGMGVGGMSPTWLIVSALSLLVVALPNRLSWVHTTAIGACLSGLGYISYSLYLTHLLAVGALTHYAAASGWISGPLSATAVYAGEVAIALLVAVSFYYLVEKPSLWLSHRIKLRPATP